MSKYKDMLVLKKTKSRTNHVCANCGILISEGENYYKEHIEDKFLHSLHAKAYCLECYTKFGDKLIKPK